MPSLDRLNKEETRLRAKLDKVQKAKRLSISRAFVRCGSCYRLSQIGKLIFLQEHWYTPPQGCTGGDYWNESDDGYFVCPHCGRCNRNYGRGKPFLKMRNFFLDVYDYYPNYTRGSDTPFTEVFDLQKRIRDGEKLTDKNLRRRNGVGHSFD